MAERADNRFKNMKETKDELKDKLDTSSNDTNAQGDEKKEGSNEGEADTLKNTDQADENEGEEKIDYRAELEKLQQERDNYKEGMLSAKDKLKKLKAEEGGKDRSDIDEIKEEIRREMEGIKRGFVEDYVQENITSLAETQDEANLIKYHYENTLVQTGTSKTDIETDIKRAKLLANYGRYERELKEIKRALSSEMTREKGGDYGSQREPHISDVELTPADKQVVERLAKRRNISFEEAKKKFISN